MPRAYLIPARWNTTTMQWEVLLGRRWVVQYQYTLAEEDKMVLDNYPGEFCILGGARSGDENPMQTAWREFREEALWSWLGLPPGPLPTMTPFHYEGGSSVFYYMTNAANPAWALFDDANVARLNQRYAQLAHAIGTDASGRYVSTIGADQYSEVTEVQWVPLAAAAAACFNPDLPWASPAQQVLYADAQAHGAAYGRHAPAPAWAAVLANQRIFPDWFRAAILHLQGILTLPPAPPAPRATRAAALDEPPTVDNERHVLTQAYYLGCEFDVFGSYDVTKSRGKPLFDFIDVPLRRVTFGGRVVEVPEFVVVGENGETMAEEFVATTREAFQNAVAARAKVEAGYGAFSGEMAASYTSAFASNADYAYAYFNLYTRLGSLRIVPDQRYLSKPLLDAIEALPRVVDASTLPKFEAFFDAWGTHYTSQVHVGASLQFNVSVAKTSQLSSEEISAMMKAEYRGLFVSGSVSADITASSSWSKYQSNRQVGIRVSGGDTALAATLMGADPEAPSQATVNAIKAWTASVPSAPAVSDFQLDGIWTLALADPEKSAALQAAWARLAPLMRPKVTIEVAGAGYPAINLSASTLHPDNFPTSDFGCRVVVLRRDDPTPSGVLMDRYYCLPKADWYPYTTFLQMYDTIADDIAPLHEDQRTPELILLFAGFGLSRNAPMTGRLFQELRVAGAGSKLTQWMEEANLNTGQLPHTTNYFLVGILGYGPGTGVELLDRTWTEPPPLDTLTAFLYRQSGSRKYTLGAGDVTGDEGRAPEVGPSLVG